MPFRIFRYFKKKVAKKAIYSGKSIELNGIVIPDVIYRNLEIHIDKMDKEYMYCALMEDDRSIFKNGSLLGNSAIAYGRYFEKLVTDAIRNHAYIRRVRTIIDHLGTNVVDTTDGGQIVKYHICFTIKDKKYNLTHLVVDCCVEARMEDVVKDISE